jgi:Fe-S oxidoreductase
MPLPTGDVIGILADNLRLRGSVLPISRRSATRWSRGLDLPRGGETVLYTGLMYQLVPSIEVMVEAALRLGDTRLARLAGLGRRVNRVVNLSALVPRPRASKRREYERVLRDVAALLQEAGIDFGYLYEDDLYSGALAWDLGADEVVAEHAQRVVAAFRRHGVRRVITVDPHTTTMLRTVYPRLVEGFDLDVRSYLEVLAERKPAVRAPLAGEVALHDSCVYARGEGVVEQPRALLGAAGLDVREPVHSGRFTWCCGGPAESLFPEKAIAQAGKRVEELRRAAPSGVTMCPLCLVNLRRAADGSMAFRDVSHYLVQAYGPNNTAEVRK